MAKFLSFKVPTKQAEEHQDVNLQTWKRHDGPMVGKCHDSDDEKLDMTTINIYFAEQQLIASPAKFYVRPDEINT